MAENLAWRSDRNHLGGRAIAFSLVPYTKARPTQIYQTPVFYLGAV